jgi:hypothetical protein
MHCSYQTYLDSKFCLPISKIVDLRGPARYIRLSLVQFVLFNQNPVLLPDVLQLLMLFAGNLTRFKPKSFLLIIFIICAFH